MSTTIMELVSEMRQMREEIRRIENGGRIMEGIRVRLARKDGDPVSESLQPVILLDGNSDDRSAVSHITAVKVGTDQVLLFDVEGVWYYCDCGEVGTVATNPCAFTVSGMPNPLTLKIEGVTGTEADFLNGCNILTAPTGFPCSVEKLVITGPSGYWNIELEAQDALDPFNPDPLARWQLKFTHVGFGEILIYGSNVANQPAGSTASKIEATAVYSDFIKQSGDEAPPAYDYDFTAATFTVNGTCVPASAPRKAVIDYGDNVAVDYPLTHGLATTDVVSQIMDKTTGNTVLPRSSARTLNALTMKHAKPPTNLQMRLSAFAMLDVLATPAGLVKYLETYGDAAAKTFTIIHNLNQKEVGYVLYNTATGDDAVASIKSRNLNDLTIEHAIAPASGEYRVLLFNDTVSSYMENYGDGILKSFVITHNLGTLDVGCQVIQLSETNDKLPRIKARTINTITIEHDVAPAVGDFRALIFSLVPRLNAAIAEITVDHTVYPTNNTILADATTGAITVTLELAADRPIANQLNVKKTDASANNVIIAAQPGELIDGNAAVTIFLQNDNVTFESDGVSAYTII